MFIPVLVVLTFGRLDIIEPFHFTFSGAFSCCDHISWCWPQLLHKSKLVSCKFLLDRYNLLV